MRSQPYTGVNAHVRSQPDTALSAHPAGRWAVTALFAANGVAVGSFLARIPVLKADLGLGEAALGAVLLGPPLGTIVAVLAAGAVLERLGTRSVSLVGITVGAASLIGVGAASAAWQLFATLTLLGMGLGAMDLAMNARGSDAEQRAGTSLMVGFHGAWSLGALAGGAVASLSIAAGLSSTAHLASIAAGLALAGVVATRRSDQLGQGDAEAGRSRLAIPRGPLVPLAVAAVAATLAEGAVGDWAGVFLHEHRATSEAVAATGFVAFAATMAAARLVGDAAVRRFGPRGVARSGGALAVVGFIAAVASPGALGSILAFALVGLGIGPVFPLMLADAGRRQGGQGIAAVSAVGYTGLVLGPPLIGFAAEATTLPTALLGVSVVAGFIVVAGRKLPEGA